LNPMLGAEILKKQTKPIDQIKETRNWFFEKINKTDKPLITQVKKKKNRDINCQYQK